MKQSHEVLNKEINKAFEKAGVRLKECPNTPLDPTQKRKIDAADKAIKEYLEKMDKAFKLSQKSTLVFGKIHSSHTR